MKMKKAGMPLAEKIAKALREIGLEVTHIKMRGWAFSDFKRISYTISANGNDQPTSCDPAPQVSCPVYPSKNHRGKPLQRRKRSNK